MRIKLTAEQKALIAELGDSQNMRHIFKIPQKRARTVTEFHRVWMLSIARSKRHQAEIQRLYDEVKLAYPANEQGVHHLYAEGKQGTVLHTLYFDRDFHMDSLHTDDADNEEKMSRQEQITKFLHLSEPEIGQRLNFVLRLRGGRVQLWLREQVWKRVREALEEQYRSHQGILRKMLIIEIDGYQYYVRASNYEGHFVKFEWCGEVTTDVIKF